MRGYLIDSNHLGRAVRRDSSVHQQIKSKVTQGMKVGTCVPVLCEIQAGARNVNRPDSYDAGLRVVMRMVRLWPLTFETARLYGEFYQDLKRRGRACSQVDIMLAALCRELGLTLVTTDGDFQALPWLKTEDWSKQSSM